MSTIVKDCEVLIVDYYIEELKVGPKYTQVILARDDFPCPTNDTLAIRLDLWIQLAG